MNNKGFTLVEVLAVIVILGLVALIATPGVMNYINSGKTISDKTLYNNIKTASESMYQELDYSSTNINEYDNNGNTSTLVTIDTTTNSITTNIQTLVSNGFLTGINNENVTSGNKNPKIILNSNGEDIGSCKINIKKTKTGNKISYEITAGTNTGLNYCPTDNDLKGE